MFNIISGLVHITDPCYNVTDDKEYNIPAVNGEWNSVIEYTDDSVFGGNRVKSWEVNCQGSKFNKMSFTEIRCGVDSGQLGIFDVSIYNPEDKNDIDSTTPFYQECCDLTLKDKQGGELENGFVTSSGWGDGTYTVELGFNQNKELMYAKAYFIEDEDEYTEDEDEDYDDE